MTYLRVLLNSLDVDDDNSSWDMQLYCSG
jgi:hypothetical protein